MKSNDSEVTASDVSEAALEILKQERADESPLYLAKLGTILSARFGKPIRSILGEERLSRVLKDALGNRIIIDGKGATISVRLNESSKDAESAQRFDSVVWAAFSKPITGIGTRFLKRTPLFDFSNSLPSENHHEYAEILASDIADINLPKTEREKSINENIRSWCFRHGIEVGSLSSIHSRVSIKSLKSDNKNKSANTSKINILKNFVEAIPAEKRQFHNLNMELIFYFLSEE